MKEGFGGNAADIQTGAAQTDPLLNQAHLASQISRPKGGGIASRSAAKHGNSGLYVLDHGHSSLWWNTIE
jgi:hypothetical protein